MEINETADVGIIFKTGKRAMKKESTENNMILFFLLNQRMNPIRQIPINPEMASIPSDSFG